MSKAKTIERQAAAGAETQVQTAFVVSSPVHEVGICSTCRHQSRCLFFHAARQAIHHCEEFDDRAKSGDGPNAATRATVTHAGGINLGQGQATGLCVNCDTRLTCIHRTPGETVLECEDYS